MLRRGPLCAQIRQPQPTDPAESPAEAVQQQSALQRLPESASPGPERPAYCSRLADTISSATSSRIPEDLEREYPCQETARGQVQPELLSTQDSSDPEAS